jgi:hypothetical protein
MKKQNKLATEVRLRKEFVARVLRFVEELLVEEGVVFSSKEHSAHTNTIRHLINFADFSFYYECGLTMFGGNIIKVWHHPGKEKTAGDVLHIRPDGLVLDVRYHGTLLSDDGDRVNLFKEGIDWQLAIRRVMRREQQILASRRRVQAAATRALRALRDARVGRVKLETEAIRLRLRTS